MKILLLLSLIALNLSTLHANLIWDNNEGWASTTNTIERFNKESPLALEFMNMARVAQNEGSFNIALNNYRKVIKNYPDSMFAPEAYFQSALIHKTKRQYKLSFKELKTLSEQYQSYENLSAIHDMQFEIAELMKGGARPYYWGIIPGFRDKMGSIEFYEQIVKDAPFSEQAPISLLQEAEVYFKQKEFVKAIDSLDRVIDGYPASACAPLAYIRTGEIYESLVKTPDYDQGATKEAINYYEDFLTIFKDHEKVQYVQEKLENARAKLAYAQINVGDFYFQSRRNPKAAVLMYKEAINAYPNSEVSKLAEEKIEAITNGAEPKKTPVDFLFGKYERPTDEEWIDEAKLDSMENKRFDMAKEALQVIDNNNQTNSRNLSEENEAEIQHNFQQSPDETDQNDTSNDNENIDNSKQSK